MYLGSKICKGMVSVGNMTNPKGNNGNMSDSCDTAGDLVLCVNDPSYNSLSAKLALRQLRGNLLKTLLTGCMIAIGLAAFPAPSSSQPLWFGSSDNPAEHVPLVNWQRQSTVDFMAGFSLIGAQWRSAGNVSARIQSELLTGFLSSTFRTGLYGTYRPDFDETYDLFRSVEYLKLNTRRRDRQYLRAGTSDRMRLGTGHLVNFYSNQVSWDERTPGLEGALFFRNVQFAAFTDNFLINGVTGGRLSASPLAWLTTETAKSLTLGVSTAFDLKSGSRPGNRRLYGYNVDLSFQAASIGDIFILPFVSVAWYDDLGSGLSFGANVSAENLIDLVRIDAKIAIHYNSNEFIPGYFGSFYRINDGVNRIVKTERDDVSGDVVGTLLSEADGGNDLETELRVLFFDGFEFWYQFRRHYGSRRLSEYHLRLFFSSGRIKLMLSQDRAGLRSFLTLFNDLGDLTSLTFRTDYRLSDRFWIFVRSRYSFEQLGELEDGTKTFLVQRRFEPLAGLRLAF